MTTRAPPMKLRVPDGFQAILEGLAREVLRTQPADIIKFSADYFNNRIKLREENGNPEEKNLETVPVAHSPSTREESSSYRKTSNTPKTEPAVTEQEPVAAKKTLVTKKESVAKNDSVVKKESVAKKDSVVKKESVAKKDSVVKKESVAKKDSVVKKELVAKKDSVVKKESVAKKDSVVNNELVAKKDSVVTNELVAKKDSVVKKESVDKKDSVVKKESVTKKDSVVNNELVAKKDYVVTNELVAKRDSVLTNESVAKKDSVVKKESVAKKDSFVKKESVAKKESVVKKESVAKKDSVISQDPTEVSEPSHESKVEMDEDVAAAKIQSIVRGHQAREEVKAIRTASNKETAVETPEGNNETEPATNTNDDAAESKDENAEESESTEDQEKAAVKIQASFRGHQVRKNASAIMLNSQSKFEEEMDKESVDTTAENVENGNNTEAGAVDDGADKVIIQQPAESNVSDVPKDEDNESGNAQ